MYTVGIAGITGYAGFELLKSLSQHPNVKIIYAGSESAKGQSISSIFPMWLAKDFEKLDHLIIESLSPGNRSQENKTHIPDILFTALPHGLAMDTVAEWINLGTKVIDLSADFRLKDLSVYENWYGKKHNQGELLQSSVYGLAEIYREEIAKTSLVANPGCFPTGALLPLYPLVAAGYIHASGVIIDAKTGVSGGGKTPRQAFHFPERTENFQAYKVGTHRHTPEIFAQLAHAKSTNLKTKTEAKAEADKEIELIFTPHLSPMSRGIFTTIYAYPTKPVSEDFLISFLQDYYHDSPFVFPIKEIPETKWVAGTNNCLLTVKICPHSGRIILMSAIDNLIKGASGQAIQNMNLMLGLKEDLSLDHQPAWP